jgi:hypothetical protein
MSRQGDVAEPRRPRSASDSPDLNVALEHTGDVFWRRTELDCSQLFTVAPAQCLQLQAPEQVRVVVRRTSGIEPDAQQRPAQPCKLLIILGLAPQAGLEPATLRLTG